MPVPSYEVHERLQVLVDTPEPSLEPQAQALMVDADVGDRSNQLSQPSGACAWPLLSHTRCYPPSLGPAQPAPAAENSEEASCTTLADASHAQPVFSWLRVSPWPTPARCSSQPASAHLSARMAASLAILPLGSKSLGIH